MVNLHKSIFVHIMVGYISCKFRSIETKITLTNEDKKKHFEWCWNKTIENFKKEGLFFNLKGEHFDYFKIFFDDIFYNQKEERIKNSVKNFFDELFDIKKPFTKSDLDMIVVLYKLLDKSLKI